MQLLAFLGPQVYVDIVKRSNKANIEKVKKGSINFLTQVQVDVNIPPDPTPPQPIPQKRALDEKKTEKHAVPMGSGNSKTCATRHPEGTTRGPFFIAHLVKHLERTPVESWIWISTIPWLKRTEYGFGRFPQQTRFIYIYNIYIYIYIYHI